MNLIALAVAAGLAGLAPSAQEPAPVARTLTLESGTRLTFPDPATVVVELPDGTRSRPRALDPFVRLQRATFDPLAAEPRPELLPAAGSIRLVQFETQLLDDYRKALAALGVTVHRVVPSRTVIARVPDGAEARLRALPFVRWVGPFAAEYRIEPGVLADLEAGRLGDDVLYHVQAMEPGLAAKEPVAAAVEALGGSVEPPTASGYLLRAVIPAEALGVVAALDGVHWIDRAGEPRTYMSKVREDGGANLLEAQTGFTGQGVRGEVLDLGCNVAHPDFAAHPLIVNTGIGPPLHGTEVTGIVFGTGATSATARGLLPDGQGIFSTYTALGDRYLHTQGLLTPPFEAVFQTNSWGPGPVPPSYPSAAFEMDDIIFGVDMLICQAMANEGNDNADAIAWAKNVVSVGGIRHHDTLAATDDDWSFAGSIGPAQDGRIKPDVAYWYDDIRTTSSGGGHTSTFGGTSAATPETAGHFGLVFQMWHEELYGNVATGASVFASRPHSATARALVFNSTKAYAFSGAGHDLTRTHQGWGRASVGNQAATGDHALVVDEWRPLGNLQSHAYQVEVELGAPRLRATLVYTDPPGTSSSLQHRINDLTLRVTSPGGTIYWGNHGLSTDNFSDPGGAPDATNTTEQVWLDAPDAGTWTVEVLADEVLQDAHLETPGIDADYALVVTPVLPAWTDLGQALAGAGGAPALEGEGFFVPGSPYQLELTQAAPSAPAFVVIGATRADAPLFGGTLVPTPSILIATTTDAGGELVLDGTTQPGTAPGATYYAQAWVLDPSGPQGVTASNAVEVRAP